MLRKNKRGHYNPTQGEAQSNEINSKKKEKINYLSDEKKKKPL